MKSKRDLGDKVQYLRGKVQPTERTNSDWNQCWIVV